jgi:hypothetical protein
MGYLFFVNVSLTVAVGMTGDMIGQDALPENLVARCLDVLRILSPNERDLIRVVVEVVHELRDTSDPEEDITVSVFLLPYAC